MLGLLLGAALTSGIAYLALQTVPTDRLLLASSQPTPTAVVIVAPTLAPEEIEVTRVVIETQLSEIEVTREFLKEVTSTPDPNLPNPTPLIHTREVSVEVEVTREVILTSIPNPISAVFTSTVTIEELNALSTQIAADIFATQTAEAALLTGTVSASVTPTTTQSTADLGLPSGEWSVRSYRTDDQGVVVVNGHIVTASLGGQETDWININDFLHDDKPNYANFISMNGGWNGSWGFELRNDDNIVWGSEGDSREGNNLIFVQTVQIFSDDSVEEVNLRDFERELVGGVWTARVQAEDTGVMLINGFPVAGSFKNVDFDWVDVSSMFYADQENEVRRWFGTMMETTAGTLHYAKVKPSSGDQRIAVVLNWERFLTRLLLLTAQETFFHRLFLRLIAKKRILSILDSEVRRNSLLIGARLYGLTRKTGAF